MKNFLNNSSDMKTTDLLTAVMAASLVRAIKSAPTKPGVL